MEDLGCGVQGLGSLEEPKQVDRGTAIQTLALPWIAVSVISPSFPRFPLEKCPCSVAGTTNT